MNADPMGELPPLPLWTLIDPAEYARAGFPAGMVFCGSPGYGQVFPLFTHPIRGDFFAGTLSAGKEYESHEVGSAADLRRLLKYANGVGIRYVAVNCQSGHPLVSPAEQYLDLPALLARLPRPTDGG